MLIALLKKCFHLSDNFSFRKFYFNSHVFGAGKSSSIFCWKLVFFFCFSSSVIIESILVIKFQFDKFLVISLQMIVFVQIRPHISNFKICCLGSFTFRKMVDGEELEETSDDLPFQLTGPHCIRRATSSDASIFYVMYSSRLQVL